MLCRHHFRDPVCTLLATHTHITLHSHALHYSWHGGSVLLVIPMVKYSERKKRKKNTYEEDMAHIAIYKINDRQNSIG